VWGHSYFGIGYFGGSYFGESVAGPPPDPPTHALSIDLDRSWLFDADEDVTADVLGSPMLTTDRGQDLTRVLSPPIAGLASFQLDNTSGDYSSGGDLKAGRNVRLRTTYDGTVYDVWRGFLDHPVHATPGGQFHWVNVQCFGSLARLAGRSVSTELYENISTGAAIGHLLDAAGYQKNLQEYLDSLLPVGGWNLASTSGDDPDTSGNGNDASIIEGSGDRGAVALDDSGTLSFEFDGGATWALVADVADVQDIFATGGLALCLFNADSDGTNDVGTLIAKSDHSAYVYRFYVADQSGATMRLRFHHETSGTDGVWETDRVVTVGRTYLVAIYFDRSLGAGANPTIWLADIEAGEFNEYTVGAGITETASPSGTPVTDAGYDLIIGMTDSLGPALPATFDGRIGTVRLYGDVGNEAYWTPLLRLASATAEAAARHLDDGETEIEWWWVDNEDALAALEMLKNSEGPGAALYEDATGAIVFKGRHARNMDARSTSIQTTFNTGSGTEPRIGQPFAYEPGIKDVVNVCEIDTVKRTAAALGEVWALGEQFNIAAGETKQFTARASDPFTGAIAPTTGGGDYTVVSGSIDAPTLSRTSGASTVITITSAAGATISGLRLRAEAVEVTNSSRAVNTIDTSASIEDYGVRTYRLPVRPEIGFNLAQDFCNAIVSFYADGRPTASITLHNGAVEARMVASLEREVGDRVHVVVGTELDQEMYVENIRHELGSANYQRTTFGLTQAQGIVSYFTIDESVLDGDDVLAF
jgi:hypothetical protein